MASERLRLPPSPSKRTPSPTISLISQFPEDKRKDGREILERLQAISRGTPHFLSATGRTATSLQVSSGERPENVKTIKERVRSTDNLTGKGLLAADLIKNLQSQQKSSGSTQFLRTVSPSPHGHSTKIQTQRPRSENSARLLTPDLSDLGRRRSLPASSIKQKSRAAKDILNKYNANVKSEENTYEQGSLPSLRKVSSANMVHTIYQESEKDDESDKTTRYSMLDVKKNQRRASINVPSERRQRPRTSENREQRLEDKGWMVSSSLAKGQSKHNVKEEKIKVQDLTDINQTLFHTKDGGSYKDDHRKNNKSEQVSISRGLNMTNQISKDDESGMSGSESDTEDSVEDIRPLKKKRTLTHKKNVKIKEDFRKEKDSSSDENNYENVRKKGKQRKQGIKKHREDDDTEEDEESEASSSDSKSDCESQKKEGENKRKDRDKSTSKKVDETDSDSESDEEIKENNTCLDNLIVDEELEEFSKQIAAPGMPAMDLLETREKLAEDGLIKKRKGKLATKKEKEDDNEEDDLDDLIDDIDDLIDADDEDIAYNNKLSKKNKFVKGARIVMSVNKAFRKDRT